MNKGEILNSLNNLQDSFKTLSVVEEDYSRRLEAISGIHQTIIDKQRELEEVNERLSEGNRYVDFDEELSNSEKDRYSLLQSTEKRNLARIEKVQVEMEDELNEKQSELTDLRSLISIYEQENEILERRLNETQDEVKKSQIRNQISSNKKNIENRQKQIRLIEAKVGEYNQKINSNKNSIVEIESRIREYETSIKEIDEIIKTSQDGSYRKKLELDQIKSEDLERNISHLQMMESYFSVNPQDEIGKIISDYASDRIDEAEVNKRVSALQSLLSLGVLETESDAVTEELKNLSENKQELQNMLENAESTEELNEYVNEARKQVIDSELLSMALDVNTNNMIINSNNSKIELNDKQIEDAKKGLEILNKGLESSKTDAQKKNYNRIIKSFNKIIDQREKENVALKQENFTIESEETISNEKKSRLLLLSDQIDKVDLGIYTSKENQEEASEKTVSELMNEYVMNAITLKEEYYNSSLNNKFNDVLVLTGTKSEDLDVVKDPEFLKEFTEEEKAVYAGVIENLTNKEKNILDAEYEEINDDDDKPVPLVAWRNAAKTTVEKVKTHLKKHWKAYVAGITAVVALAIGLGKCSSDKKKNIDLPNTQPMVEDHVQAYTPEEKTPEEEIVDEVIKEQKDDSKGNNNDNPEEYIPSTPSTPDNPVNPDKPEEEKKEEYILGENEKGVKESYYHKDPETGVEVWVDKDGTKITRYPDGTELKEEKAVPVERVDDDKNKITAPDMAPAVPVETPEVEKPYEEVKETLPAGEQQNLENAVDAWLAQLNADNGLGR